jgi:heat shock protein HtpX
MASITTLKINSYFFIGLMFLIFGAFIAAIGIILGVPVIILAIIFLFVILFQILISSTVVKWSTRTKYLEKGEVPYLEEMVERLSRKAGVPMPKLGIVDDPTPNAFVFGLTQGGSTLSVHRGLLEQLNDKEIEAVVGHELGHIKNRDCMYMTILSVMPLIAYYGMQLFLVARFSRGGKNAGQAMLAILAIAAISAVVYFLTSLLIKRVSRIREFYADAHSGVITEDPHSLASALTKITYGLSLAPGEVKAKNSARQFYIGNVQNAHHEMNRIMSNKSKYDLDGDGVIDENELELAMAEEAKRSSWDSFSGLFATHPPTFKRILALKEMEKEISKGTITQNNKYEKVEF